MSVITFWNNKNEETGKTMSIVAIATYMAIEHNTRTLLISTTNKEDKVKRCYWGEDEKKKKLNLGIFGPNKNTLDVETGIRGLEKMIKSNKITPNMITNYTKVVFKDRLEVLPGDEEKANISEATRTENRKMQELYPDVINMANQYYDRVLVDLDYNIEPQTREKILKMSDIVVINLNQRLSSIEKFRQEKEKNELLKSPKTLLLMGRYDRFSKYNAKNVSRYLKEKNRILTIPYNTLFFEAAEEAGVPDLFLNFKRMREEEDRNNLFIQEVRRATENIIYRLQEVQANIM